MILSINSNDCSKKRGLLIIRQIFYGNASLFTYVTKGMCATTLLCECTNLK